MASRHIHFRKSKPRRTIYPAAYAPELLEPRVLLNGAVGQIYVAGSSSIGEYTTTGATVNASLISGLNIPVGIAVSGSNLFVANAGSGTIGQYTTSGTVVNASLISGISYPYGVTVAGGDIYTADFNSNRVGQYTSSGTTIFLAFVAGLNHPSAVAVSGSDLFVVNWGNGTIGEYSTADRSTVNAALISGLNEPYGVVLSGSDLFVVNYGSGTIGEYTTAGATVNAALVSGLDNPIGLALSGSALFAAEGNGTIAEFTTAGATVNTAVVSGLGTGLTGIYVTGPEQLAFNQQPTNVITNNPISPAITVDVQDADGNLVTTDSSTVTLSVESGPGTLSGNATVTAVNGVATFANVQVTQAGNYTLLASDGLLTGAISTNFTVTVPASPVFSNLSVSSSIAQGTASVTFSGNIAAGALIPPTTESVSVTLHGVTQQAPINAQGGFTTTFNTSALPASNSPYQVVYTYNGDGNFTSVTDNITTTLLVKQNNGDEEPVWRLFSPITKEHLYTADPNEVSTLVTRGWIQEGGVFFNVYTGLDTINGITDVPMYRLYDIVNQQHLYTTDPNEYNTLKDFVGIWSVDGVFGYIFPTPYPGSAGDPGNPPNNPTTLASVPNSTALYRLNYPFAPDLHLLTIDQNEWNTDALVYGWTKEGIIGYVLSS